MSLYHKWSIVLTPEGKNDGKNEGGMIVEIANGSSTQELSRVAFVRRNSANPNNSYERQLELEISKARTSVKILNESATGALA